MTNSIGQNNTRYDGTVIAGSLASDTGLGRFIPEPRTSKTVSYRALAAGVTGVVGEAMGVAGIGLRPEMFALLQAQAETQMQMQIVSLQSNLLKSQHETQMAAVRNIRTG